VHLVRSGQDPGDSSHQEHKQPEPSAHRTVLLTFNMILDMACHALAVLANILLHAGLLYIGLSVNEWFEKGTGAMLGGLSPELSVLHNIANIAVYTLVFVSFSVTIVKIWCAYTGKELMEILESAWRLVRRLFAKPPSAIL